jgi:hypothetical protein
MTGFGSPVVSVLVLPRAIHQNACYKHLEEDDHEISISGRHDSKLEW